MLGLYMREEVLVKISSFVTARRIVEIWLVALLCSSKQCELRNCDRLVERTVILEDVRTTQDFSVNFFHVEFPSTHRVC